MHCSSPVSARCVCVWVVEPHTGCGASGWPCMALGGRVVSGLRGAWAYMHMLALPASRREVCYSARWLGESGDSIFSFCDPAEGNPLTSTTWDPLA